MCDRCLEHDEEVLCHTCMSQAPIITSRSFADGEMCRTLWYLLPIVRAAAMFRYPHGSRWRRLVTFGKFRHRRDTLLGLGRIMGRHFMPLGFFEGIDVIIPMPISRKRLRSRGYNQATLIARGVGKATGLEVLENVVAKRIDTKSQITRSKMLRLLAMQGCFAVKKAELLAGRHVLLIDDVFTTGASIVALGEAMRDIPGIRISVLTLTRATL